jgi:hypothetical protein
VLYDGLRDDKHLSKVRKHMSGDINKLATLGGETVAVSRTSNRNTVDFKSAAMPGSPRVPWPGGAHATRRTALQRLMVFSCTAGPPAAAAACIAALLKSTVFLFDVLLTATVSPPSVASLLTSPFICLRTFDACLSSRNPTFYGQIISCFIKNSLCLSYALATRALMLALML